MGSAARTQAACFEAWRVTDTGSAYPLDIGEPETWDDAVAEAQLGSGLQHKDILLIQCTHPVQNELRSYAVKQKSQPIYRKCEDTGLTKPFKPLYLAKLFSLPVDSLKITRPFDAFTDDATGLDRTLVRQ